MTSEALFWNSGLLFASLSIVLGVIGLVGIEGNESRIRSCGYFLQGVILVFVAGAVYFPGSLDLRLGGMIGAIVLIIQHLLAPQEIEADPPSNKNGAA